MRNPVFTKLSRLESKYRASFSVFSMPRRGFEPRTRGFSDQRDKIEN
jgi:hypothetical protein